MDGNELERLRSIKTFPSLVKYLRDELDWPIETDDFDDLTFEYEPEELGIDSKIAVKIKEIKQLRPLSSKQPWGIFFVNFAPKRLPVVVLRRVLQSLVIKKRQSANKATQMSWLQTDLLFISSYGESDNRAITFAHFTENIQMGDLPVLKVLGWDKDDTAFHLADAHDSLKEKLSWPDDEEDLTNWRKSWASAFILRHREVVETSKQLAIELADLATNIRTRVNQVLAVEDPENGPMRKLMAGFKEALIHDLSEDDFADMYAQTIAYGLLAAAISRHVPGEELVLLAENIADMVPVTNPFLKELLGTFLTVGGRKKKLDFDELGINDIIDLLRHANLTAVLHDFGNQNPLEDPVIHFYELFLKEYDAEKRTRRGVFYTPKPVVSFIVRNVHEILKKDFGLEYGLADTISWGEMSKRNKDIKIPEGVKPDEPFVQILDPATGTGTFLVETIDVIYKEMATKWNDEGHLPLEFPKLWDRYVPKHLLPRLYGFELLMAPYTIAHMKIGLKLKGTGYRFQSNERARIYLTNTLEEPKDISGYFEKMAPALAHEAEAANRVKSYTPVTIVIGNPPYAGLSSNMNPWIDGLLKGQIPNGPKVRSYYEVDGKPLGEKKLWLQDDYVKFIRYAQWRIENIQYGILGYISNHAYLDNPTFRGMRQQLMLSFQQILVFDLHGSSKKRECPPGGCSNSNVFDIQQGVGISLFCKHILESEPSVLYSDLWGTRKHKYSVLLKETFDAIRPEVLSPSSPYYFFIPRDEASREDYEKYYNIIDIMNVNTTGVQTGNEKELTDFSRLELSGKLSALENSNIDNALLKKYAHKPFDNRWMLFIKNHKQEIFNKIKIPASYRSRYDISFHLIDFDNLALLTGRSNTSEGMNHFFVSKYCSEVKCAESSRGSIFCPLYLYPEEGHMPDRNWPAGKNGRTPNLDPKFVEQFADAIVLEFVSDGKGDLKKTFGPEDVFNYIYAIFHSTKYRDRYAEFIKIDFPRVPITLDTDMFKILCSLGNELVGLHLMESDKLNDHITTFPVSGDNTVIKVGEKGKTLADVKNGKGKLFINKTEYFDNLPEEVWNFHIGGYQVCYKWLYDRKKASRKLSAEDIEHYHRIVVAINETIKIMKQIDEVIAAHGGWPDAFILDKS